MICIGAVIPSKNCCGFVVPVFADEQDVGMTTSFFCETDKDGLISNFSRNESQYEIVRKKTHNNASSMHFGIGDSAPLAFAYSISGNQVVFIASPDSLRLYMKSALDTTTMPIEAKYKAIQFLGGVRYNKRKALLIYQEYYLFLCKYSERYAKTWMDYICEEEQIDKTVFHARGPFDSFARERFERTYIYRKMRFDNLDKRLMQAGISSSILNQYYVDILQSKLRDILSHPSTQSDNSSRNDPSAFAFFEERLFSNLQIRAKKGENGVLNISVIKGKNKRYSKRAPITNNNNLRPSTTTITDTFVQSRFERSVIQQPLKQKEPAVYIGVPLAHSKVFQSLMSRKSIQPNDNSRQQLIFLVDINKIID